MWRVSSTLNKRGSKYFHNRSYIFTCVSSVKGAELVAKTPFVEKSSLAWQKFKRCTGVLSHHSNKTELVTLQENHQFSSLLSIYIFMNHQLRESLQTNIWLIPSLISNFSFPISVTTQTASIWQVQLSNSKSLGPFHNIYTSMIDSSCETHTTHPFKPQMSIHKQCGHSMGTYPKSQVLI